MNKRLSGILNVLHKTFLAIPVWAAERLSQDLHWGCGVGTHVVLHSGLLHCQH